VTCLVVEAAANDSVMNLTDSSLNHFAGLNCSKGEL